MRPVVACLCAALCAQLMLQAPARAAEPGETEAASLEATARQDFASGRYEKAAKGFARAHALSPAAITKYNEGFSWQKANRLPEQADAYQAAIAIGTLDAERSSFARERLNELDRQLGVLVVRKPVGARLFVAHAQGRTIPARVYLPPGEHDVLVRQGGESTRETVMIEAAEQRFLAVAAAASGDTNGAGDSVPWETIAGWSAIAVGGVFAVGSIASGAAFLSARSDFVDGGQTDAEQRQRALDLRTASNVTAGLGVAFGGVGLTLLLLAPESPKPASTSGALVVGPDGLMWRARW
jgi:hypothetical protein